MPEKEKIIIEETEQILPSQTFENFEAFLETSHSERLIWATFLVPEELLEEADNIRPFNEQHIKDIAESIMQIGQREECIGSIEYDEVGRLHLKVIAGLHRKRAVRKINNELLEPDQERFMLRVNFANKPLNPYEVIEIQMAENLHNKMTPAEDAKVIVYLWKKLRELAVSNGQKFTIKSFSAKVSRSLEVVKDAISYIDGLDSDVQNLVDEKVISYHLALLLPKYSKKKEEGKISEQLRLAQTFVIKGFTTKDARKYLKSLSGDNGAVPLFSETDWENMIVQQHILGLHGQSGIRAQEFALWTGKIVRMIKLLGDKSMEAKFSAGMKNTIGSINGTVNDFQETLEPLVGQEELDFLFKNGGN